VNTLLVCVTHSLVIAVRHIQLDGDITIAQAIDIDFR
jgi:hypothetical protein